MDLPIIELENDGVPYTVDFSDFDGIEWRDIKRETGYTPQKIFQELVEGDLEAIAAVLWIARRREEGALPFERVLKSIKLRDIDVKGPSEDGESEGPPTSPADGDS